MRILTLSGCIFVGSILISPVAMAANVNKPSPSYMEENHPEGWYFYKDKIEIEPPVIEPELAKPVEPTEQEKPQKEDTEDVEINSQWLRDNLPRLLDEAQDNPTYENVRRYMYAQRILLDQATEFSAVYGLVAQREAALNESIRRPSSANELSALSREITKSTREILTGKRDKYGVYFFFSSDCVYCKQSVKVLDEMIRKYNMDILPVSLNGQLLNVSQKIDQMTVFDDGTLTDVMPVDVTPTFYLINTETLQAVKLAVGYQSSSEFVSTTLRALREVNVITEREFQSTKQVKDILLSGGAGEENKIKVNEEQLYEDPDYLAEKMRQKFKEKYLDADSPLQINQASPTVQ